MKHTLLKSLLSWCYRYEDVLGGVRVTKNKRLAIRIINPDDKSHFLDLFYVDKQISVEVCGFTIGLSKDVVLVKEVSEKNYEPVIYFPRSDLNMQMLEKTERKTRCPLKGSASYFSISTHEQRVENGAWSYENILDFDRSLELLRRRVAFDVNNKAISIKPQG